VWSPGNGSAIHDHGNAHCLMKILSGDLTETRYSFPKDGDDGPMQVIAEKTHSENSVAYMADELGVHRVWNNGADFAVSLHCRCLAPRGWSDEREKERCRRD
jgi:predicted metal-dependent enzyme (double-stranded beta helix superfamily)